MGISPWKELWSPGDVAHFEYHCWESPDSADAELWYRSHQQVTILSLEENDGAGMTFTERCEAGHPYGYKVRFKDGFVGLALDDELMSDASQFSRPDPPTRRV